MTRWIHVGVVAAAVVWGIAGITAQTHAPVPFEGSVRDIYNRGGPLEGATVTVTSHVTKATVTLRSDVHGRFYAPTLDPGTYTIVVSMPGYGRLVADSFCVVPGRPARFDAGLGPDRGDSPRSRAAAPQHTTVPAPVPVPSIGSMTLEEVRQAMRFGRGNAALKVPALSQSGFIIPRRVGAIFTPFWRVATMSQIAAATNRQFTEDEIPAAFTQRMVWIVGTPAEYYEMSSDMDSPQYLRAVTEIAVLDNKHARTQELKPAWNIHVDTACDVTMLESVLGPHFRRPSLVSAFPLDVIEPGNVIVFRYSGFATTADGDGAKVKMEERRVRIKESDVRKWK